MYFMRKKIVSKKIIIYTIMTVCWIALIFSFSLQPADASSELSSGFGKMILETFAPELLEELEAMPEEQLGVLHHLLRKCAHFSEYFVLGLLVMLTLCQTLFSYKVSIGVGVGVLVAAVDEMIQRFVPGRSGQMTDVLLDTVGACAGILAVYMALGWMQPMKRMKVRRNRGDNAPPKKDKSPTVNGSTQRSV